MKLCFGDCVEFPEIGLKGFVIGEYYRSTDGKQIVVVSNSTTTGFIASVGSPDTWEYKLVGAGFHNFTRELQKKYLELYPKTLKGIFNE